MTVELEKAIASKKILFGIKQTLKNVSKINKAYVSLDSRDQIKTLLKMNKIGIEIINLNKRELTARLGLDFECEVFGLKI